MFELVEPGALGICHLSVLDCSIGRSGVEAFTVLHLTGSQAIAPDASRHN